MRTKIGLAILCSFVVSFSIMSGISLSETFDELYEQEKKFYSHELIDEFSVFIIGSSHSGRINVSIVNELINDVHSDVVVYNLGVPSDNPEFRLRTLEDIVSKQPDIVFYGISYRDFNYPEINNSLLPEPKSYFSGMFILEQLDLFFKNPKRATLENIRGLIGETSQTPVESKEFYLNNTPFHPYYEHMTKTNTLKSKPDTATTQQVWKGDLSSNKRWLAFSKIITTLQENNIEVIIFTTPQSQVFLDILSQEQKNSFEQILEILQESHDLKIHDYTTKYSRANVWDNPTHLAFNEDGFQFSNDVAEMIIQEIEE